MLSKKTISRDLMLHVIAGSSNSFICKPFLDVGQQHNDERTHFRWHRTISVDQPRRIDKIIIKWQAGYVFCFRVTYGMVICFSAEVLRAMLPNTSRHAKFLSSIRSPLIMYILLNLKQLKREVNVCYKPTEITSRCWVFSRSTGGFESSTIHRFISLWFNPNPEIQVLYFAVVPWRGVGWPAREVFDRRTQSSHHPLPERLRSKLEIKKEYVYCV